MMTLDKENWIQTKTNYTSSDRLCQCIAEKSKLIKKYKDAVNSHVTTKQELLHKGNIVKLNPAKIQEDLSLKKLPTEKQTQAFIDEKYSTLTDELAISKENLNIIKKELELIDNQIKLYEYQIQRELVQIPMEEISVEGIPYDFD